MRLVTPRSSRCESFRSGRRDLLRPVSHRGQNKTGAAAREPRAQIPVSHFAIKPIVEGPQAYSASATSFAEWCIRYHRNRTSGSLRPLSGIFARLQIQAIYRRSAGNRRFRFFVFQPPPCTPAAQLRGSCVIGAAMRPASVPARVSSDRPEVHSACCANKA